MSEGLCKNIPVSRGARKRIRFSSGCNNYAVTFNQGPVLKADSRNRTVQRYYPRCAPLNNLYLFGFQRRCECVEYIRRFIGNGKYSSAPFLFELYTSVFKKCHKVRI